MRLLIVLFSFVFAQVLCGCLNAQNDASRLAAEYSTSIQPILEQHCFDCHSGDDSAAGVNLESYQNLEQILDDDRKWASILNQVSIGAMPPEDEEPLTAAKKANLTRWIQSSFDLVSCENSFPGTVTIRKLNRIEYRNSVRDLLGVDYRPSKNFPGDDIGYGFDNIADVLSLPPVLMEKYLDAAEVISQLAIVDPNTVNIEIGGGSFTATEGKSAIRKGVLSLYTNGTVSKNFDFRVPGVYALAVKAYGTPAAGEYPIMSALIDGKLVDTVEVEARRRKPRWYGFKLEIDDVGQRKIKIRFENDFYDPEAVAEKDRNLFIVSAVIRGPARPESNISYLKFESNTDAEAGEFIERFLPRVFRTKPDREQIRRFQKLYAHSRNNGATFHQALQKVVQAALISPQFLYKLEKPIAAGQIESLSDHERATSLSYFLWNTTPDDQLLDLADEGKLNDLEVWRKQVDRLYKDEKSNALIENFVTQWLNLKLLDKVQPDPDSYPGINGQLLLNMKTETQMVVSDVFRRDGSLFELLDCEFTYLNNALVKHYDLPIKVGTEFQRVDLADTNRAGILTHASFLTLTSNPTRTSPVKRGKWVMENILGLEPPPALPDVAPLDEEKKLVGSLRERMQQHRADPACASCHTTMDAIGFSLENFDGVGRFRLKDEGFDIDPISELPDGVVLNGSQGLQSEIATTYRDQFVRCFTEKLLTYAIGRGIKYFDRCAVDKIMERAKKRDYRISEFIRGVAESDPFLKRGSKPNGLFE